MGQHLPYLVTVLSALLVFILAYRVGAARGKYGINAPATTGNVEFEYVYRTQMNTIESFVYFLPLMWTFSVYVGSLSGGFLGLVWLGARIVYAIQYSQGKSRTIPFVMSIGVCVIYLVGSLIAIVRGLI